MFAGLSHSLQLNQHPDGIVLVLQFQRRGCCLYILIETTCLNLQGAFFLQG
jgi:hypothetical protein